MVLRAHYYCYCCVRRTTVRRANIVFTTRGLVRGRRPRPRFSLLRRGNATEKYTVTLLHERESIFEYQIKELRSNYYIIVLPYSRTPY